MILDSKAKIMLKATSTYGVLIKARVISCAMVKPFLTEKQFFLRNKRVVKATMFEANEKN